MRHLRTAVLGLALALSGCSGIASADHVPSAEAHALVAAGATLLDVRTDAEWSAGHLPGAVHVPLADLADRMGEIPRDHPVVVYCRSGARSANAAAILVAAGYEVHDLGGMSAW
jgi:rhodanese-related sulfurtransferase